VFENNCTIHKGATHINRLNKVFSGDNFYDNIEAINPVKEMGRSNHNVQQLCDPFNHKEWDAAMKFKDTEANAQESMYTTEWETTQSSFKFPQGKFESFVQDEYRCNIQMCAGPHAAILPPFKPSCDFANNNNNGPGEGTTNWYQCPNLPNPDFFTAVNGKSDKDYFFQSNLWRKPHLYGNNNGEWNGKAYRYKADADSAPLDSTKKVFMNRDIGNGSVNTTYAGDLLCDRTGAVAQQSILDDDLVYVCGGHTIECDHLCELYSIKEMKSAAITDVESNCEGRTIGLKIKQSGNLSDADTPIGVIVSYVCEKDVRTSTVHDTGNPSDEEAKVESIPAAMKTIYFAKTVAQTVSTKTFLPQEFIITNGNPQSKTAQGGKLKRSQLELGGTVCYTAGEASIKYLIEDQHTKLFLKIEKASITITLDDSTVVTKTVKNGKRTCVSANNEIRQAGEPSQSFFRLAPFSPTDDPFVTVDFFASSQVLITSLGAHTILSSTNVNKSYEAIHADYRWATSNLGYVPDDSEEPIVGCYVYNGVGICGDPSACAERCGSSDICPSKCISYYYDVLPDSVKNEVEDAITNKTRASKFQGYLKREPLQRFFKGYRFQGRSKFTKIDSIITEEACTNKSKVEGFAFMELQDINFLKRKTQPHFHEPKPELVVRSPEACTENTTRCHTFTVDKSDPTQPIRQCFHAVGCDQQEYVNTTGLDVGNATVVNATDLGICVGFEVCQRAVTATFTDISQHAGIQPKCRFVRACESQVYKRTTHPFDDVLGNINLGTCLPESKCGSAQFDRIASTYLEESECVEIQTCNESQFERNAPTKDSDRDCVIITECTEDETEAFPPTSTSDRQCVAIDITCDFNQYHDGEGCKDATACALSEREVSPLNTTVDRQCIEIEQCQFNQKLIYKTGSIELVCEDLKYTSEHEDIAILAVAGFVAACSLIFRLLVK